YILRVRHRFRIRNSHAGQRRIRRPLARLPLHEGELALRFDTPAAAEVLVSLRSREVGQTGTLQIEATGETQ
ncbi:MAG: hypothetical protein WBP17_06290, partial [Gemmatimonadota bacterium]